MKRRNIIDLLKGICIIFVILDHYTNWGDSLRLQLLFPYWINMAVPVFMILSGYVYSISYERHSIHRLSDAYHYQFILDKYIRYTIPFLIAFFLEFAISAYANGIKSIMNDWIRGLFTGGWGPGSYYYPIMVQFIFIFPLIYFTIKKYDFAGVVLCGILNALYEWIQYVYDFSYTSYRLLIFRYTLLIAYGCYIYIGKSTTKKWLDYICVIIGISFIWLYYYNSYEPKIIIHWTQTCFIAVLFIMPFIKFLLTSEKIKHLKCPPFELIGKASYNIFLVQMVYFNYVAKLVYCTNFPTIILNLINLFICICCGIIFYIIETRITKKVLTFLHALNINKILNQIMNSINTHFTLRI